MITIIDEGRYAEMNSKLDRVIKLLEVKDTSQSSNMSMLTNEQVKKVLDVSFRTLQNWRDQGLLGFFQIGRKIMYKESDVLQFVEHNHRLPFVVKKKKEKFSNLNFLKNAKSY